MGVDGAGEGELSVGAMLLNWEAWQVVMEVEKKRKVDVGSFFLSSLVGWLDPSGNVE